MILQDRLSTWRDIKRKELGNSASPRSIQAARGHKGLRYVFSCAHVNEIASITSLVYSCNSIRNSSQQYNFRLPLVIDSTGESHDQLKYEKLYSHVLRALNSLWTEVKPVSCSRVNTQHSILQRQNNDISFTIYLLSILLNTRTSPSNIFQQLRQNLIKIL